MTISPIAEAPAADAVLLDTCALISLVESRKIAWPAEIAIRRAAAANALLVSVISAWEVGLLSRATRRLPFVFLPDPQAWFAELMLRPGVKPAPLTAAMAIASSALPGYFHRDPADCLLVATARALDVPLVTSDRLILAYAAAGHLQVIPC